MVQHLLLSALGVGCRSRPKADLQPFSAMLRCGPSERTFAARAKFDDGRTHSVRTNRPYASAAFAHAASFRIRGKANAAARLASSKQPLDGINLDELQSNHTMWADHIFSLTAAWI
jgi:hypothetical protein